MTERRAGTTPLRVRSGERLQQAIERTKSKRPSREDVARAIYDVWAQRAGYPYFWDRGPDSVKEAMLEQADAVVALYEGSET